MIPKPLLVAGAIVIVGLAAVGVCALVELGRFMKSWDWR